MDTHEPEALDLNVSQDEKNMGLVSHLLGLCGYIIPFGNLLGPLIVYLIKKDQSPFIRQHAAEALNFQISLTIYAIISMVLVLVFIGILMLGALMVLSIVFIVIAAIRASEGKPYRYPLTIRFVS